jgi:hypothetical protein
MDNAMSRGLRARDGMVFVFTSIYSTGFYDMYLSY